MPPTAFASSGTRAGWATPTTSAAWSRSCARRPRASSRAPRSRWTVPLRLDSSRPEGRTSPRANGTAVRRPGRQRVGRDPRAGAADGDVRRATSATTTGWPTRPRPGAPPTQRWRAANSTRSPRSTATTLDEGRQITADILEAICDRSLARIEHRLDLLDVANHMNGAVALLGQIATLQRADTPDRLDRFEARLRAFPAYFAASVDLLHEGIAKGVTAPRVVAERTVGQLDRLLELAPEDSPVAATVDGDARGIDWPWPSPRPSSRRWRRSARRWTRYLPATTETIGISALPDGDGMYAAEILGWTSLPLDPHEVHERGVERLAAINEERMALAAELGYPDPATRSPRTRRRARTRPRRPSSSSRSPRIRFGGAGMPLPRSSAGSPRPTARCDGSRSSARRTSRWPSTTRPPTTARARASTTSTATTCRTGRCTTSRA